MTHTIKTLRYFKSKGPGHAADETIGACSCGRFEVIIAGDKVKEAGKHLAFHLRKHGDDQ